MKEAARLGAAAVLPHTIAITSLPLAKKYGEVAGLLGKIQHARVRTSVEPSLQFLADSICFVRIFGLFSRLHQAPKTAR
jgi:hypothetical protein